MKIWRIEPDVDNYDNITFVDERDWEKFQFEYKFNGDTLKGTWSPLKVEIIEEIKKSDFPSLASSALVISERALLQLKHLLEDTTEVLPLRCEMGMYFILNVVEISDCLDRENSSFVTFRNSNKIKEIYECVLDSKRISHKHIFKISDQLKSYPFVSEQFKQIVEEAGLDGILFKEIQVR